MISTNSYFNTVISSAFDVSIDPVRPVPGQGAFQRHEPRGQRSA